MKKLQFSPKQRQVLDWWREDRFDAVICDGAVRSGKTDGKQYLFADRAGTRSLPALIRYLIYDFHALMNQELTYTFLPSWLDGRLDRLTEEELRELDRLAGWLSEPDRYFRELCAFWEQERKFRILHSPLVGA